MSLFNLLADDRHIWTKYAGEIRQPERYFPPAGKEENFPDLTVDSESIALRIEETYADYGKYFKIFLTEKLSGSLREMIENQVYELESGTWVEVLLQALESFLESSDERIVQGLLPAYFLRQLSFVRQTRNLPPARCEELFHEQARELKELVDRSGFAAKQ